RTFARQSFKSLQIKRIDVAGYILDPRHQPSSQIPHSAPNFQYPIPAVPADGIRHPCVEFWCVRQARQDMASVDIALVNVVRQRKLSDRKQCPKAISPIYLFPFRIGSSGIANGNLENSRISLSQFDRDLGLQAEIIRLDGYRLQ